MFLGSFPEALKTLGTSSPSWAGAGAAGVNGWLNGLRFAVEFRFLSPLLDLARGSIPSPVCDIKRSPQPQACPHLVLAACAGLGTRGRGVSAQPSRRSQFGRRARLTCGLFESVPAPRARRRAINSAQDGLGCGRASRYFRMLPAGSCRGSCCSISGWLFASSKDELV